MPTHLISRHRGLTLIEVMIGMVIGLIGIIVITQVYLVNESYKRSTTGAGSAQVNGAIALYTLERDLRMAGYGIASSDALGCGQVQYYYNGAYSSPPGSASGALPPIVLAPVVITDGGGGPDTITVMYSTDAERIVPATLSKSMPTPSAELNLDNPTGFSDNPGDLIILSQGGVCTLMQVTQVQVSALKLQHNPGSTALWNPAGGGSLFPAYSQGASVFNLGRPLVNTYSISSSSLRLLTMFTASATTVVPGYNATPVSLISDIVDLQAQYGKDNGNGAGVSGNCTGLGGGTANDGIVDCYDNNTPTTAIGWQQVLSVRIGVLARSQNYEKPEPAGSACTATTAAPTWDGGTFAVPGGIPSCYKYRAFETVVPLRNMIWRQS